MKKLFFPLLAIIFAFGFTGDDKNPKNSSITADEVYKHVKFLASDELKGRFTGSKECEIAANYIENDFKAAGLKPFFKDGYLQKYSFVYEKRFTDANKIVLHINNKPVVLEYKKDFVTGEMTGNQSLKGKELVFAGYGIVAPKLKYDDYANIDVKDKVVIVMRSNPDWDNPHSEFANYESLPSKTKTALEKGAVGIIFVNGAFPDNTEDKLSKMSYEGKITYKGISAVQMKRSFVDKIFESENLKLSDIQKHIDTTNVGAPFHFNSAVIDLETEAIPVESTGLNVAGIVYGSDEKLKDEYIVIGAHFDHLGMGVTGSLYRGKDTLVHNGADDNASGTAGVMEIAEYISSLKLKRSVIFACFSGEELGLFGSAAFVEKLPVDYSKVVTMINMDMIGRMQDDKSMVINGTGTSSIWKDLLNNLNKNFEFKLSFVDDGFGPSDHSSFYAKQIPVLFFMTGTHSDYHKPSDDYDKINSQGEESLLKYVAAITEELANRETKPDYINVPRKEVKSTAPRVYVGTIPNYSDDPNGFKINGVSEGSPAQKGGLQAGDIITKFGGKKIMNIYDYSAALGEFTPGQEVEIEFLRNGEKKTIKIILGSR